MPRRAFPALLMRHGGLVLWQWWVTAFDIPPFLGAQPAAHRRKRW